MNKSKKDSIFPYFYCNDCEQDVDKNDHDAFSVHHDHRLVEVREGDSDPGLVTDFKKKGLMLEDDSKKNKLGKNKIVQDERNDSKKLYDFALSKIKKLIISENNQNDVYAVIEINSHIETLHLATNRAKYWMNVLYSNEVNTQEIRSDEFYKGVLNAIISMAQMKETLRSKVYNRIAQLDGEIYYDLGNPQWELVHITKEGVNIIKQGINPPYFRRSQSLYEQVVPEFDDDNALDKLADLLHIVREDRLVFKVNVVSLFFEACPIPIIVFDGNSGSLKTTATTTVKRIVDPNGKSKEDNAGTISTKSDDLIIQLYNRYLASFDNVSRIDQDMSDIMCRAITGSSNLKRELYTNADETILSYRRKIVLNGIVPTLDYPDLRERLVFFSRETIDETNRMGEEEFEKNFRSILPGVLGSIFTTLCKAMNIYDTIKTEIKPQSRMADFEIWGEAVARSLGCEKKQFLEAYYNKLREGTLNAKDHYQIVNIIQILMEDKKEYESTISSLYGMIKELAVQEGIEINSKYVHFPKSSNQLTRELKLVNPLLTNLGLTVELFHYTKNDRKYTKNSSIVKIRKKIDTSTLDGLGMR